MTLKLRSVVGGAHAVAHDLAVGVTSRDLQGFADMARKVRRHVVRMTHAGKASHVGSCLSAADILAVLYCAILRIAPDSTCSAERDRFIL
ncbi:MAG: hypothetical protein FJY85_12210, partial [Deltaproteobacteria bacterium]|nr:hypothetical protein [Deltaproteobacteria bacterium]